MVCVVESVWSPHCRDFLCKKSSGFSLSGFLRRFVDDNLRSIPHNELKVSTVANGSRDSVLTVDASGSMLDNDWPPSRLEAAKEASLMYVTRLAAENPNARVAIVGYGSESVIFCSLTQAREVDALKEAIRRIDYLGGTNIRDGLKRTAEVLRASRNECDVVLLSDGHNTDGCPKSVAAELKKRAIISCVGIGGSRKDVDEDLLKWIASEYPDGSKRYRWIGDKERLIQHFHQLAGRITRR